MGLQPGFNLVGWDREAGPPEDVLQESLDTVRMVYSYDQRTGQWERYGPDLPEWVNSLRNMEHGKAYWIVSR